MILGIDTSIGTAVAIVDGEGRILAERASTDTRGHAEAIGGLLAGVLSDAGIGPEEIEAVAVGMGPGPFTGLRVGIAAARAFAIARGIPLLTVPSHAAVAAAEAARGASGRVIVLTDARRREHYWTVFDLDGVTADSGVPIVMGGPGITFHHELEVTAGIDGTVARIEATEVSAAALAGLAIRTRAAGMGDGPQQPLYLREPDVTPSKGPKRVTG